MQQHFNENYMESEKYPYAIFKGRIIEELDLSKPGVYSVNASGTLTIHGVDQDRKLSGKLTVGENSLVLETSFDVMLIDHKIEVPKLVFKKIAEKIEVSANINYTPYVK
jgi:polyisoprenoid-binding protein YceI